MHKENVYASSQRHKDSSCLICDCTEFCSEKIFIKYMFSNWPKFYGHVGNIPVYKICMH